MWTVDENKEKVVFIAHFYWVRDVEFSSYRKFKAIGGGDNLVKVWDLD